MAELDVRPWNLRTVAFGLAAVAVPVGCTNRSAGGADGGGGGSDDVDSTMSIGSMSQDGAEVSSIDGGVTTVPDMETYVSDGYVDGYIGYCYYAGCDTGQICTGICDQLIQPEDCTTAASPVTLSQIPLGGLDGALAIAFADVDGDGIDEVVTMTDDQFFVSDGGSPVVSARTPAPMPAVADHALTGTHFGSDPAVEGVVAVSPAFTWWHETGGTSTVGAGTMVATPVPDGAGGVVGSPLVVPQVGAVFAWGSNDGSVFVQGGQAGATLLTAQRVAAAAWRPAALSPMLAEVFLVSPTTSGDANMLYEASIEGSILPVGQLPGGSAVGVGWSDAEHRVVVTNWANDPKNYGAPWTSIHVVSATTQSWVSALAVEQDVLRARVSDLNGDGTVDVAFGTATAIGILEGLGTSWGQAGCQTWANVGGEVYDMDLGDFDGDGDDEIAAIVGANRSVVVIDVN